MRGKSMMDACDLFMEEDGDISLNWQTAGSALTVSVSPSGKANFAWLLSDGTHDHGLIDMKPGAFIVLQRKLAE